MFADIWPLWKQMGITALSAEDINGKNFFSSKRSLYMGIDPSAPSLHLGNIPGLIAGLLSTLFGHDFYILLGSATLLIGGDPSGKKKKRVAIDKACVQQNATYINKQLINICNNFYEYVLSFKESPSLKSNYRQKGMLEIIDNYEWISKIDLITFLRTIGTVSNMNIMLNREFVKNRINSHIGLSYAEFSYQLIQAIDFVYLAINKNIEVQIGGKDQTGNMISGFDLYKSVTKTHAFLDYDINNKEHKSLMLLLIELLTTVDGEKFGKTEGNALWIDPNKLTPYEMYQVLIRVDDTLIEKFMRALTLEWLKQDVINLMDNPKKLVLCFTDGVIHMLYGKQTLQNVKHCVSLLNPGKITFLSPEDCITLTNILPKSQVHFIDVAVKTTLDAFYTVSEGSYSRSELRQICKNKGLYINTTLVQNTNVVLTSFDFIENKYALFSIGKNNKFFVILTN